MESGIPQITPWTKVIGSIQFSTNPLNEIQLITLHNWKAYNTSSFTRFTYHDSNPLSMRTIDFIDIPEIEPIIFSQAYKVLITSNNTLDPFTGNPVSVSNSFTFNPSGYSWLSYAWKSSYFAELIINYDYPNVHIIDTSGTPLWVTYSKFQFVYFSNRR